MKKVISLGLAMTLAVSTLLTGCKGSSKETAAEKVAEEITEEASASEALEEETSVEEIDMQQNLGGNALADELMKKYSAGAGEYDGNVIKVKRDESIQLTLGYNPWGDDAELSPSESFVIYQDADLKFPVEAGSYEYDAETGILTIEPPFYGIGEMDSDEIDLSHLSGNYLCDEGGCGWGTLAQYYLVTKVDTETGEELSKPLITVVKVKSELSAPQMTFEPTDDGYARFTWKEVPGAEGYLLFTINTIIFNGHT